MKIILVFILVILIAACTKNSDTVNFAAASQPAALILAEITGDKQEVNCLVPPGASPHTFSPSPSSVKDAANSKALFFISPYLDGWAANLSVSKIIRLVDFLPDSMLLWYDSKTYDPHFWTDPLCVKAIVRRLTDTLIKINPAKTEDYRKNSSGFIQRLDSLDNEIRVLLSSCENRYIFTFHPSFNYFIRRYNLIYGGSIEESPGKEPTPNYIVDLVEKIKKSGVTAIFSEPQLPEKIIFTIAETAGVTVLPLDPNGGSKGCGDYFSLMRINARTIRDAASISL